MKTNTQTKEDKLLLAQLEDKQRLAEDRYMITCGDFLDAHQRKLAEDFCRRCGLGPISCKGWLPAMAADREKETDGNPDTTRFGSPDTTRFGSPDTTRFSSPDATWSGVRAVFYGGYAEAERCLPVFLPEYVEGETLAEEMAELLRVIRVCAPTTGRKLTHRDYLGSLLALGIDRARTGDILVRDETSALGPGADIIVKAEIADFIELNYSKAGRTELEVEILPLKELHVEPPKLDTRHDTVASLRLDSVVASAFRMSRAKAAEAIRRGLVSVNSTEALKVDAEVEEGDRIVLRGQGKIRLSEVGGSTRKDRIRITISMYR